MGKRGTILLLILALALFGAGCGSDDENLDSPNTSIRTIENGLATTITTEGGTSAAFPANTFVNKVTVMLSDILTSSDGSITYFPTATKQAGDLLGGMVINTPVDEVFNRSITAQFELRPYTTATSQIADVTAGQEFAVYRFDFDNLRWNRWGGTVAVVNATRTHATCTLPTNGFRGFIGSLAIFRGFDAASLPAVVPTTITGRVVDHNGNGVSTDVGLYIMVGALKFPADVNNGRVPALNEPTDLREPITAANTVDSGVDGYFTMQIPENLIGQLINLEFGHEDTGRIKDEFNVQAPAIAINEVDYMVIRYGDNNVVSQPVGL